MWGCFVAACARPRDSVCDSTLRAWRCNGKGVRMTGAAIAMSGRHPAKTKPAVWRASWSIVVVRFGAMRTLSGAGIGIGIGIGSGSGSGSGRWIRIAGHARFVRAGRGFRRRLGDVAPVAWPRLGITRIAPGMRIGCRWCRPVALGHLSSPIRTPRRGSPTACSRPAIPKFPSPPSHPSPASASSGSAAGNRRLR